MSKREALILTLAGSLATSGVGRYEEHYARAERLVDEVLAEETEQLRTEVEAVHASYWNAADGITRIREAATRHGPVLPVDEIEEAIRGEVS
ncbi:hypothetical protein AB0E81_11305 [Streptomyces sp. NPDC033538]|uniref:hypothetical protein n=1 Tax=Streptomyces sp. NPDC033538 TaxID=3155367 RepID=UPI0033C67D2D